jgi:glycosyltransferase involved in cell wall biosynthesis
MSIDIIVPTYNCGPWIDEFIESLLKQDYDTWRVITRDDGSTDDTIERVLAWSRRLGDRMTIVSNPDKLNCGPVGNYNIILSASSAQWVMLADPDDIWKPGKISLTFKAMLEAENGVGSNKPVVVFTDAEVVDERGAPLAESYWKWSRLRPELSVNFHRMLVESAALSSTMMVNRAALNLALPIIGSSTSQDWWLALVACAFGKVMHLKEKTITYRRHSSNETEAPLTASAIGVIRNIFIARQRVEKLGRELALQAAAFVTRFRTQLSSSDIAALEAAARLPSSNFVVRRWIIIRHGLWFSSLIKNIGLIILL